MSRLQKCGVLKSMRRVVALNEVCNERWKNLYPENEWLIESERCYLVHRLLLNEFYWYHFNAGMDELPTNDDPDVENSHSRRK